VRAQLDSLVREMVTKGITYDDARREFERRFLQFALDEAEGNIGDAAARIGIHRNTFSRKLDEYGIKKSEVGSRK
jgi:DNA-binding NtrC family response regulator